MAPGSMGEANLDGDELRDAMQGQQQQHDPADDVAEIFEVDGDTTGADPDADDPAVNIRPHVEGNLS